MSTRNRRPRESLSAKLRALAPDCLEGKLRFLKGVSSQHPALQLRDALVTNSDAPATSSFQLLLQKVQKAHCLKTAN